MQLSSEQEYKIASMILISDIVAYTKSTNCSQSEEVIENDINTTVKSDDEVAEKKKQN